MKRIILLLSAVLIFLPALANAQPIQSGGIKRFQGQARVPNEIIVKFESSLTDNKKGKILAKHRLTKKRGSWKKGAFEVFRHSDPRAVLESLRAEPGIVYAEQNAYAYASTVVPNDPYYTYQWDMPRIGVGDAWELSRGRGATVAIIDTGVRRSLQDLAQTQFVPGYDFVNKDSDPDDDEGHGSHVCGTIAQSTDNALGVVGIAHQATIMPIKVLNKKGSGSYDDIADGIMWAADHGADIINLSLGGPTDLQVLRDACEYAWNHGVLIVVAAGNESTSTPSYPAAYVVCLSVSATTSRDSLASYSNYGPTVDLAAPGGDSEDYNGDGYPDMILQNTFNRTAEGYYFYAGTSMAAPHVAGVAALAKGIAPALTNADLRALLENSAEDIGATGRDDQFGFGLIDAYAATLAAGGSAPVNNPPVADFAFVGAGLQVQFSDASTDRDGAVVSWSWDFGDGTISEAADPSHPYQKAGTYVVTLTVTDDDGASDAVSKEVSVWDGDMTMSVKDIALSVSSWGRILQARAQITILNNEGLPVEGATVAASWSGAVAADVSGVTGADGKVLLISPRFRGGNQITVRVNTVTDDLYLYDPTGNTETSATLSW